MTSLIFFQHSADAIKKYMANDPENTKFSLVALAPTAAAAGN